MEKYYEQPVRKEQDRLLYNKQDLKIVGSTINRM